jgi:hypothetical protein
MSQANVETLKRAFEAWNRRDLELFLDLHDAAFEVVPLAPGGPYHGRDGVLGWWEDSFAVFPDMRAEIVEIRDLGAACFSSSVFTAVAVTVTFPSSRCVGRSWLFVTRRSSLGGLTTARRRPLKPWRSETRLR